MLLDLIKRNKINQGIITKWEIISFAISLEVVFCTLFLSLKFNASSEELDILIEKGANRETLSINFSLL